jgi:hypothetical protein
MTASEVRGADYRANAQQALALANSTSLPQVRLRHEEAASRWLDLASFEDQRAAHQRGRLLAADPRSCAAAGAATSVATR